MSNKSSEQEYKQPLMHFRLVVVQSSSPGAPPRWVVHTAVKPEPGLEIEFTAEPISR
jgi:hypothetical protein